MKKRAEKSKPKSASAKNNAARKAKPAASSHDHLHSLLRGAHAHRVCGLR
jgi:hypothetical protein